jgi:hypothetical protein
VVPARILVKGGDLSMPLLPRMATLPMEPSASLPSPSSWMPRKPPLASDSSHVSALRR